MIVRTRQTHGADVLIQSEEVLYLRRLQGDATGVVMGLKGFNEFFISVDAPLESLVEAMGAEAFISGAQTGGATIAVNRRCLRYARAEAGVTIAVMGSKGGEEFAVSMDMDLDEFARLGGL